MIRRRRPPSIVGDNGAELASTAILCWPQETRLEWHHFAPGRPTQNASTERFNGRLRLFFVTDF